MLTLYGETFPSRLLLGTAAYPTPEILKQSIQTARPAMITVSLRRAGSGGEAHGQGFWSLLEEMGIPVLPNTAGCQSVQEAVTTAQMAREVFETDWIKLDLIAQTAPQKPFAVAVNTGFVAKGAYAETVLNENDKVDIVRPVVGG